MVVVKTMKEYKEKEKEIKRDLIIGAAMRVFSKKPYDKISLNDIADEAGLSKASIYTYFENRESLFVEVSLREIDDMLEELKSAINKKKKPQLEDIFNAYLDYFLSHDSFFRMASLFYNYGIMDEKSCTNINLTLHKVIVYFETLLRDMGYKEDARTLAHTLMAALHGILITYEKSPGKRAEEKERHVKRIGRIMSRMFISLQENNLKTI